MTVLNPELLVGGRGLRDWRREGAVAGRCVRRNHKLISRFGFQSSNYPRRRCRRRVRKCQPARRVFLSELNHIIRDGSTVKIRRDLPAERHTRFFR